MLPANAPSVSTMASRTWEADASWPQAARMGFRSSAEASDQLVWAVTSGSRSTAYHACASSGRNQRSDTSEWPAGGTATGERGTAISSKA